MLIAARQALSLRQRLKPLHLTPSLAATFDALCNAIGFVDEDRALDSDLQRLLAGIRERRWRPYVEDASSA